MSPHSPPRMGRIKDRTPETAEIEPNSLIAIIVFKTPTLRKPINLMIANMAMSDLLCPIFLFPLNLLEMHLAY